MTLTARNVIRPVDILKVDYEYVSVTRKKAGADNTLAEPTFSSKPIHILEYDGETTTFSVGETVTGATSGATGVVVKDFPNPYVSTRGWLTLRRDADTTAYQDDEVLNGSIGGASMAVANGASSAEIKCYIGVAQAQPYALWESMAGIIPQGVTESSTEVMGLNHGFDSDGSGVQARDTITNYDGDTFFVLNIKDYRTHLSALLQKEV